MTARNYIIYAIPKDGVATPFCSSDYKGLYTRKEAERVAKEANQKERHFNAYLVQHKDEPAPPAQKLELNPVSTTQQIEILTKQLASLKATSELQSENLALALKEKNDLKKRVTSTDADYYVKQIKQLQLDLSGAQSQLRAVRTLAKDFFEALGVK